MEGKEGRSITLCVLAAIGICVSVVLSHVSHFFGGASNLKLVGHRIFDRSARGLENDV